MHTLYVTLFKKGDTSYPCLKSFAKVVTFDLVIICSVLNCTPRDVYNTLVSGDVIIID